MHDQKRRNSFERVFIRALCWSRVFRLYCMTSLHALFSLRNQQAFQRLLEASRASSSSSVSGLSTSGGRSWNKPSPLNANAPTIDINSRDWLGRTVLHLTCSASDVAATEYVRLLLAHPAINVNAQDTESHWTPLHRAMYNGNLATAYVALMIHTTALLNRV